MVLLRLKLAFTAFWTIIKERDCIYIDKNYHCVVGNPYVVDELLDDLIVLIDDELGSLDTVNMAKNILNNEET